MGPPNVWHMVEDVLIAESLRVGCRLDDLRLVVTSLSRGRQSAPAPGQPDVWTVIGFRYDDDPDRLAAELSRALDAPGWYIDFHNERRKWIVYPHGTVFTFDRDDRVTRAAAKGHGRLLGVPEVQLEWAD